MGLALVVSDEGLPLTYELVPGSTYEGDTLQSTLMTLRQRFQVRHATVVADRGMLSRANLEALVAADFQYVVGARLKQLPKAAKQRLLAWQPTAPDDLYECDIDGKRLVVSYRASRARYDAEQRRELVAKLKRKLNRRGKRAAAQAGKALLLSNRGYQRFLKLEGAYQVVLDEAKLQEAAAWDGLHGVYTNIPAAQLPAADVLAQYRGLWQVEAAFRVTKHDLQVRPIYHWKEQRIQAHVAIAFMGLTMVRMLSHRVNVQQRHPLSEARIRKALHQAQIVELRDHHDQQRYALPIALPEDAKRLYKTVGLPYRKEPFVID